jgi:hypothetical protein
MKSLIILSFPEPIHNRYFNGKKPEDENDPPPQDTSLLTLRFKAEQFNVSVDGKPLLKNGQPVKAQEGYLYWRVAHGTHKSVKPSVNTSAGVDELINQMPGFSM